MNGVSRFLSRRDKNRDKYQSKLGRGKTKPVPADLYTVFSDDELKAPGKEDDKKVKTLVQRLQAAGITKLGDTQAQFALSRYPNDLDRAFGLLVLANDAFDGIIKDFDSNVTMLGAVNRNMVTCYLDALLFAMFARLDSFEAMLFDNFNDEPRKRLAAVLRLWVNLLRTGELIPVELTKHLQDSLARCGWEEAAEICQQDASEAFTFITGALELPLLTLKMDIYHTGREDKEDDHKFVNERLLEVAIPEQEGDKITTLEDCLETYFNNRIEVKRYLQRQNTLSNVQTIDKESNKDQAVHIETVEISSPSTPIVSTPTSFSPVTPTRPTISTLSGRRRADSIFSERYTLPRTNSSEKKPFDEKKLLDEMLNDGAGGRPRSSSLRKEVMMPAWQFFSLIPWYTDNVPQTDAQVAAHFSAKRPVLGICLKRYMMRPDGTSTRLNTFIDIPLEIGLPHFISDERMKEEGPLFGNFKLVLQSVVCHRGISLDSGHYVSLVRANVPLQHDARPGSSQSNQAEAVHSWLRFDDIASPRVVDVNIKEALREESPYLLFYQVQPIDEELASRGDPPSYAEASAVPTVDPSLETLTSITETTASEREAAESDKSFQPTSPEGPPRTSMDGVSVLSLSRGRTAPTTPLEEQKGGFFTNSRRNSKTWMGNKSRPTSQSGENRLSFTISRLTGRGSKDKLQITDASTSEDPIIVVEEIKSAETSDERAGTGPVKENSSGLGRTKSKKGKEKKRLRSKSREPGDAQNKNRPDRECVVM